MGSEATHQLWDEEAWPLPFLWTQAWACVCSLELPGAGFCPRPTWACGHTALWVAREEGQVGCGPSPVWPWAIPQKQHQGLAACPNLCEPLSGPPKKKQNVDLETC